MTLNGNVNKNFFSLSEFNLLKIKSYIKKYSSMWSKSPLPSLHTSCMEMHGRCCMSSGPTAFYHSLHSCSLKISLHFPIHHLSSICPRSLIFSTLSSLSTLSTFPSLFLTTLTCYVSFLAQSLCSTNQYKSFFRSSVSTLTCNSVKALYFTSVTPPFAMHIASQ